jgi:hypothetical protein
MSTVHHQDYLNTVYTQYMLVLLVSANRQPTELAWQIPIGIYSVEILLMMDSGLVRNM